MRRRSKPAPVPTPVSERPAAARKEVRPDNPLGFEADVDGSRVRITARDEVVIECGQASITLRRNGRVVVRGTYVETVSSGTNRVKGGQVRVN
jgi:plasmid replication initiation protein